MRPVFVLREGTAPSDGFCRNCCGKSSALESTSSFAQQARHRQGGASSKDGGLPAFMQMEALSPAGAFLAFLQVVARREEGVRHPGVLEVVNALRDEPPKVGHLVDARAGQSAQLGEHALASRRDLGIGEYQVRIHAFEHVRSCLAHFVVGEVHFFDDAAQVGESAAVVRAQDGGVGHVEALEHVHHVVPAFEGQQRAALRERLRFLGRFLAVAVVGVVQIDDAVGLAERLHEEGVVCPACTGNLLEADAALLKELTPIDGRPDGGMVAQQMSGVLDGEWLRGRVDAVLVAAVQLALLRRVGQPDAPIGRLDDVDGLFELVGESQHVLVHARLQPIIGLHDGYISAVRLVKPTVAAGAVALVSLVDDAYAPILHCMLPHDLEGGVGRPVVEADDLQVAVGLPRNAVQALVEVPFGVVDGDDHADQRVVQSHVNPLLLTILQSARLVYGKRRLRLTRRLRKGRI